MTSSPRDSPSGFPVDVAEVLRSVGRLVRVTRGSPATLVDGAYVFECPTCSGLVQVPLGEVNCRIFRHAAYRDTHEPIPPHTSQGECLRLLRDELVVGCTAPLRLVLGQEPYAELCGYI